MNAAHLHLLLNHFPIIGLLFGIGFLGAALIRNDDSLRTAAKIVLVLVAVATIPTYLSGEPAEDIIEGMAGISKAIIHEHEEAGLFGLIWLLITGTLAGALLFRGRRHRGAHFALLGLCCFAFVVVARVASLGGDINHPELRAPEETSVMSTVPQE